MKRKIKFSSVFWGCVLIAAAALLLIGGLGISLGHGINAWRIIAGAVLFGWLVYEIVKLRIPDIFFPLAFLFIVFEEPIAYAAGKGANANLVSNWIVLLAALLLTIGFSILLPKKNWISNTNFSKSGVYFDAGKDLGDACIHDNVGNVEVYVTNRNSYNGSGVITIRDNLGKVRIHVPGTWLIALQASDNIGKVDIPEQNYPCSKSLTLVVKDNLGLITVVFD